MILIRYLAVGFSKTERIGVSLRWRRLDLSEQVNRRNEGGGNGRAASFQEAERFLIAVRISETTSARGLAPRFPLPWTRTLTALPSLSRCPITATESGGRI